MIIELPGGKTIDSESATFKKLPEAHQKALIEQQEKLLDKRKRKALASAKCRAKQKGLPWPPLPKQEDGEFQAAEGSNNQK